MKFATSGVQAPRSPFVFKPIFTLWLVALFGVGAAAEATGERYALVVGNGAYQDAPLTNAREVSAQPAAPRVLDNRSSNRKIENLSFDFPV